MEELTAEEAKVVSSQTDTLRAIFAKFDSSIAVWDDALSCCSLLDALLSLASVSSQPGYVWPEVLSREKNQATDSSQCTGPVLQIRNGRHPMLEAALAGRGDGEYIPNDLDLGGGVAGESNEKVMLLLRFCCCCSHSPPLLTPNYNISKQHFTTTLLHYYFRSTSPRCCCCLGPTWAASPRFYVRPA